MAELGPLSRHKLLHGVGHDSIADGIVARLVEFFIHRHGRNLNIDHPVRVFLHGFAVDADPADLRCYPGCKSVEGLLYGGAVGLILHGSLHTLHRRVLGAEFVLE